MNDKRSQSARNEPEMTDEDLALAKELNNIVETDFWDDDDNDDAEDSAEEISLNIKKKPVKSTKLGEIRRNIPLGLLMLAIGIAGAIFSIPLMPIVIGFLTLPISAIIFLIGINRIARTRLAKCPYCNREQYTNDSLKVMKCISCKQISVRKGTTLETIIE